MIPFPTALPSPVPYPTQERTLTQGGSDPRSLLLLPRLHHVDVAVHPAEGWPAVASVWPDDLPSRRIFVRVYRPDAQTWGPAQQVNPPTPPLAEAGNGLYGGVGVGITGDGTVHVAWGGGNSAGQPVWYASSTDYGTTWSMPRQIGAGCYHVEALGATLDGQVIVLAWCSDAGGGDARPAILHRRSDGTWLPQDELPIDGQHSSMVVVGEGDDARVVVLASDVRQQRRAWIAQKHLGDSEDWQTQSKDLTPPAGLYPDTASFYLFRGATFRRPTGVDAIVFTWSVFGGNAIHALTSLDSGTSWGRIETVAAYPRDDDPEHRRPDYRWSAPAYDARADRVIMLMVRRDLQVASPGNGTHYAQASVPGSGVWIPRQGPERYDQSIPLISGATSASWTDAAQTSNGSYLWLAWVDRSQELWVRSIDLNLLVPVDQYPTVTPASAGGQ